MAVYLIRAGESGPVKIGFAANVERRVALFQAAHWERLYILRTMQGDRTAEAWLHQRFAAHRIERDWFHFHPDMLTTDPIPEAVSSISDNPITRIVALFGGQSALARALGRKQSTVWEWVNAGSVPAWQIRPIIKAAAEAPIPPSSHGEAA